MTPAHQVSKSKDLTLISGRHHAVERFDRVAYDGQGSVCH
jgi:hypothetical protein